MGPNEPISQEVGSKRNKAEPQDLPSPSLPKRMQQRKPGKPLVCTGRTLNLILPLPLPTVNLKCFIVLLNLVRAGNALRVWTFSRQ